MNNFVIDVLVIPETIDAPDALGFIEMTHVRNVCEAAKIGSTMLDYEPMELLPNWQNPYEPQVCLVARVLGRVVARGLYMPTAEDGATEAWLNIDVLPEFRQRGIGRALYERLTAMCVHDSRTVLQVELLHSADANAPQLAPPTGFGSVPLNSPETRFLLKNGFALEQVHRMSLLRLPLDEAECATRLEQASATAGLNYRVISWTGRTPAEWLPGLATLHQRMSTDAPAADLDMTEEAWNEDRVASLDDSRETSPRTALTTVVEHVPTGTLAGFTELFVPPELERPVEQQDTLVLREHRGHKLGMLLKLANLQYLSSNMPGHPSVNTFNAEENRPMLDVNEAIGFVAVGYGAAWKKAL